MPRAKVEPTEENVEDLLLEDDNPSPYLSLPESYDRGNASYYLSLEHEAEGFRRNKIEQILTGPEAMKFLGLPPRPMNHLQKGDGVRIMERFHRYFTKLIKEGKEDVFWANLTVRVWKKSNIEKLHPAKGLIQGKRTKPTKFLPDMGTAEYVGDLFDGSAINQFLADFEHSRKYTDYLLQLEQVKITEEMLNYAP